MARKKLSQSGRTLRQKWLAALESRNYKQTKETLCRVDARGRKTFCCLGLLCHLADPKAWESDGDKPERVFVSGDRCDSEMPPAHIRDRVGLNEDEAGSLAELNDSHDFTFRDIAKRIRKRDYSIPSDEDDNLDED